MEAAPTTCILDEYIVSQDTDVFTDNFSTGYQVEVVSPIDTLSRKELKRQRDREYKRLRRADPLYRRIDRQRSRMGMQALRCEESFREKEREQDRVRRSQSRSTNPALRNAEQERDREYQASRRAKMRGLCNERQNRPSETSTTNSYLNVTEDNSSNHIQQNSCRAFQAIEQYGTKELKMLGDRRITYVKKQNITDSTKTFSLPTNDCEVTNDITMTEGMEHDVCRIEQEASSTDIQISDSIGREIDVISQNIEDYNDSKSGDVVELHVTQGDDLQLGGVDVIENNDVISENVLISDVTIVRDFEIADHVTVSDENVRFVCYDDKSMIDSDTDVVTLQGDMHYFLS